MVVTIVAGVALAVALVGLLVALGAIARLKRLRSDIASLMGADPGVLPGASAVEELARRLPGVGSSRSSLGSTVLLFVSEGCLPCHAAVARLDSLTMARDVRLVVVVRGRIEVFATLVDTPVQWLPADDQLESTFGVAGTPTAYVVKDGAVTAGALGDEVLTLFERSQALLSQRHTG